MATKIKIKVGDVEIDYEGSETFLTGKIPELVSKLTKICGDGTTNGTSENGKVKRNLAEPGALGSFLVSKNAKNSQKRRFLATAEWLHRKGKKRLKTGDVATALRDNSQTRLGNPSDCLSKNIGSGHCDKDGREFFVTDDGRAELGEG
ncbi:MAG: hypothetical protein O7D91_19345 [Planctomycetota bacterium]|nr:hypothetical protein [Planctomycetota bacterium]